MYRAPYGASLIMLWDKFFRCYVGDCVDLMREMPEKAFHTCVTSPPYYALRDYGVEGQIGPEPTPAEFIQRLVEVFRAVRRVLRDDGTIWVNIGDSYAARFSGNNGYSDGRTNRQERRAAGVPAGLSRKICSACRGVSPSPYRTMVGICAKTSFGTRLTRCRRAYVIAAQRLTSTFSC